MGIINHITMHHPAMQLFESFVPVGLSRTHFDGVWLYKDTIAGNNVWMSNSAYILWLQQETGEITNNLSLLEALFCTLNSISTTVL
jgi:hypothetical protein